MKQLNYKQTTTKMRLLAAAFVLLGLFGFSKQAGAQCTAKFGYKITGTSVSFIDSSSAKGTYTVKWSFGDGGTSDNKTPTHAYAAKDSSYKVCLIVTDSANKCSTYLCKTVTVKGPNCNPSFTYSVSGRKVTFTNTSTTRYGFTSSWSFGDGSSSSDKTPGAHTYSKDSTYKVCLKVTDSTAKCSETYCASITVKTSTSSSCTASFTYSVSGRKVSFTNTSSAKNTFTSSWTFGDNTTSNDKTPTHTYSGSDSSFKVCLIIVDSAAKCSTYICTAIKVPVSSSSTCNADFSYSVSGKSVSFTNNSTAKNTYKTTWSFGDGAYSTDKNISHTYSKDTTYHVCMRIIDSAASCTSTVCKDIVVKNKYKIGGRVKADSNLAYPGRVWLIVFNAKDSSLSATKDGKLMKDSSGAYYLFTDVDPGTYYTKAALDSTASVYKKYLPTYHEKATRWKYSTKIVLSNADILNANINLEKGTNKGGKGFIKGKISAGANKVGDPMPNMEVALFDLNFNAIAYTYTDVNGIYTFNNIDYGTYQVYVEVLGIVTYPSIITLSETNQGQNNIDFTVNTTQVKSVSGIVASKIAKDNINIYPNPVRNVLNVNISTQNTQEAQIAIFDINGKMVSQSNTQVAPGTQTLHVNTANLSNGMYFLKIQLSHDNTFIQSPFVKAE